MFVMHPHPIAASPLCRIAGSFDIMYRILGRCVMPIQFDKADARLHPADTVRAAILKTFDGTTNVLCNGTGVQQLTVL